MKLPRFYPILDSDTLKRRECSMEIAAEALLEAGVGILQIRHKTNYDRETFDTARIVASLCEQAGVLFVINDRADISMLLKAALHVGQDDLPAQDARRLIGHERMLGFSTHNQAQLEASNAQPVDYVAFGPVFGTASKDRPDPTVGVDEVKRLRPLTPRPMVAIGGITRENAVQVLKAGADSGAVIGDLYPDNCSKPALRARAEEWMAITDER